jgi:hypothetical protein
MRVLISLVLFSCSAAVTSGLVYNERGWRYAMGCTAACAVLPLLWIADLLPRLARAASLSLHPALTFVVAALPFGIVLLRLWWRRIHTPRHTPGPEDDPVLRRYLEEKVRRRRKRRQEEALLENSEDPTSHEARGL